MKRYFIAVGSSASAGLASLVTKLCEERLFDEYEDVYISIDSDQSEQSPHGKFASWQTNCGRIKALPLRYSDSDNQLAPSFHPGWMWPQIPPNGVGGLRHKSEKGRNWQQDLRSIVFRNLKPNDVITLVGTAFGGTATGQYWSLAEFLSDELATKITESAANNNGGGNFGTVALTGFVLLPDDNKNPFYPIGANICDFFRELQLAHWRRRLQQLSKGGNADGADNGVFKAPVYSHAENIHYRRVSLYCGAGPRQTQGVDDSYLPMTTCYFMPTPREGNRGRGAALARVILGEQLFAVFYLGVQDEFHSTAINRWTPVDGSHDSEDPAFGGLHMLVYKSGRSSSSRKWFDRELKKAAGEFLRDAESPSISQNILGILSDFYYIPGADGNQQNRKALEDAKNSVMASCNFDWFKSDLEKLLAAVVNGEVGYAGANNGFPVYMKAIMEGIKRQPWIGEVNRQAVSGAYKNFRDGFTLSRNSVDECVSRIKNAAKKAEALLGKRLGAWQVRALNRRESTRKEIMGAFSTAFDKAYADLLLAVRCRNSELLSAEDFDIGLDELCKKLERVGVRNADENLGEAWPYVVEGNSNNDFLVRPGEWPADASPFVISALKAALEDNAAKRESIIDEHRENAIDALERINQTQGHRDVFAGTTVDTTLFTKAGMHPKPFSNAFSLFQIDNDCNTPNSSHFVIAPDGSVPENCPITCDYVKDKLEIGLTFNNMGEGTGTPFFTEKDGAMSAARHLSSDRYSEARMLQSGVRNGRKAKIAGIWIGTERSDFTLREIISRAYPDPHTLAQWQQICHADTGGDPGARRMMTLRQMVFSGALLQGIEAKTRSEWDAKFKSGTPNNFDISIEFSSAAGSVKSLGRHNLVDAGFVPGSDAKLSLASISFSFLSLALGWVRDDDVTGFAKFFPNEITAPLGELDSLEHEVLTRGRLSIKTEEYNAIKALAAAVKNAAQIQFTKH
jgi:hypothetical protein